MKKLGWTALLVVALASFFGGGWLLRHGAGGLSEAPGRPNVTPTIGSRLFQDVMRHVRSYAVDSIGEAAIYELAAAGMLDELDDPYAAILPEDAEDRSAAPLGLYLDRDDDVVAVVAVRPGSSAEQAGVRSGDFVLEVGSTRVDDKQPEEVKALLLDGEPGSDVRLRLVRNDNRPLRVTIRRGPVPDLPEPRLVIGSDGIATLRIWRLGSTAAERVAQLVDSAVRVGQRALVLDLRGVVEGEMDAAARVASLFLPDQTLIALSRGRATGDSVLVRTSGAPRAPDLPLVALVDRGTAGPSESLAGALQDHDRALLVGQTTFGRGAALSSFPLGNGKVLRLTTSHWFTPSGRPVQRGELPDTAVDEGDSAEPERPAFRTDGGRVVLGGGGIVPDREIEPARDEAAAGDDALALARMLLLRARNTRMLLSLDAS